MSSKYNSYKADNREKEKPKIHPVWRGVGFAFMILIPIMSYASMQVVLEQNDRNGWVVITPDLLAKPGQLLFTLIPDQLLYVKIGLFLLFMLIFYSIFSLVSFLITGMFGFNAKNDPFYVPPVRRTTSRRRR